MALPVISLSGLSIDRLVSFCHVVEAGSIAAASRNRGVSEGQFSRQMKELEGALQTKLFVRAGRHLRLTAEGVKLSVLTHSYFGGLAEMRDGPLTLGKPLRVGAIEAVARWLLAPRFLEVLSAAGGTVDVETLSSERIVECVESGDLDVGLLFSDDASSELETISFGAASFVLMVPRALLPAKSASGIKSVKDLPFVALIGDTRFSRDVEKVAKQNALPFRIVARVANLSLAIDLSRNLGAAVIVPSFAQQEFATESFALVPLEGIELLTRGMSVGVSKVAAPLNSRSRRAATKLSRLLEAVTVPRPPAAAL